MGDVVVIPAEAIQSQEMSLPVTRSRRGSAPPAFDTITPEKLNATLRFMEDVLAQADQIEIESPIRKRSQTISHIRQLNATPTDSEPASPQLVSWQGQKELIAPGGGIGVRAMSRNFDAIRARSLSSPQMLDPSKLPETRERSASKVQQMRAQLAEKQRVSGGTFRHLTMEEHRAHQSKERQRELREREEAKNHLMTGGSPAAITIAEEVCRNHAFTLHLVAYANNSDTLQQVAASQQRQQVLERNARRASSQKLKDFRKNRNSYTKDQLDRKSHRALAALEEHERELLRRYEEAYSKGKQREYLVFIAAAMVQGCWRRKVANARATALRTQQPDQPFGTELVQEVKGVAAERVVEEQEPEGWKAIYDPNSGKQYYYNLLTGASVWKRPTEPVPGYREQMAQREAAIAAAAAAQTADNENARTEEAAEEARREEEKEEEEEARREEEKEEEEEARKEAAAEEQAKKAAAAEQAKEEEAAAEEARKEKAAEEQARKEEAAASAEQQARKEAASAEEARRGAEEQVKQAAAEEQARREGEEAKDQAKKAAAEQAKIEAAAAVAAAEEQTRREKAEVEEQARREEAVAAAAAAEEQARREEAEVEEQARRGAAAEEQAKKEAAAEQQARREEEKVEEQARKGAAAEEQAKKEAVAEEQAKREEEEAEEQARREEAEEQARREAAAAEEQARREEEEAEEQARREEAEEQARREEAATEEQARREEAEEQARREEAAAEEQARREEEEAEEEARREEQAEEQARREAAAEEQARREEEEAEEQARREEAAAEEQARREGEEAEEQARREEAAAEEQARREEEEVEEQARREEAAAEEQARKGAAAEDKARREAAAEEQARKGAAAEDKARREAAAAEQAKKEEEEVEEQARREEAEEQARREAAAAEEQAKREAAAAEEQAKREEEEAEEQARREEAEEQARREAAAEEQARREAAAAEEQARREEAAAEEQARREEEEAEEQGRKAVEMAEAAAAEEHAREEEAEEEARREAEEARMQAVVLQQRTQAAVAADERLSRAAVEDLAKKEAGLWSDEHTLDAAGVKAADALWQEHGSTNDGTSPPASADDTRDDSPQWISPRQLSFSTHPSPGITPGITPGIKRKNNSSNTSDSSDSSNGDGDNADNDNNSSQFNDRAASSSEVLKYKQSDGGEDSAILSAYIDALFPPAQSNGQVSSKIGRLKGDVRHRFQNGQEFAQQHLSVPSQTSWGQLAKASEVERLAYLETYFDSVHTATGRLASEGEGREMIGRMSVQSQHYTGSCVDEAQWCHSLVLVTHAYKASALGQHQECTQDGAADRGESQQDDSQQVIKRQEEKAPQGRTRRISWDTGVEELEKRKQEHGSVWYNLAQEQQQQQLPQHQHQRANAVLQKLRLLSSEAQDTATKLTKQRNACTRARRRMQAHLKTR
jgi:hypothetical protein